jgi:hypothetical protein
MIAAIEEVSEPKQASDAHQNEQSHVIGYLDINLWDHAENSIQNGNVLG